MEKTIESWQIANKFVAVTLDDCRERIPNYCHAACVGALNAALSSIMIDLDVYFPEAYELISENLLKKIKGEK